jgi:hypothetical protein
MKHEWKKDEKNFYLPKTSPEVVTLPEFGFYMIDGKGNPNDEAFGHYIEALYAVSYAVKMSPKKNIAPKNYFEYTVYPLEGVWDISDEAKKTFKEKIDKDTLVFTLMIRQPDFVDASFAAKMIEETIKKKKSPLLETVRFNRVKEGQCVQMLHLGSYDDEPASFALMEQYATANGLIRIEKKHREIYLSDARKVAPEKLKTVLRFQIK